MTLKSRILAVRKSNEQATYPESQLAPRTSSRTTGELERQLGDGRDLDLPSGTLAICVGRLQGISGAASADAAFTGVLAPSLACRATGNGIHFVAWGFWWTSLLSNKQSGSSAVRMAENVSINRASTMLQVPWTRTLPFLIGAGMSLIRQTPSAHEQQQLPLQLLLHACCRLTENTSLTLYSPEIATQHRNSNRPARPPAGYFYTDVICLTAVPTQFHFRACKLGIWPSLQPLSSVCACAG